MEAILGGELWALLPFELKPQIEQAWQNHELELQAIQGTERFETEAVLNEAAAARSEAEEKLSKLQEEFNVLQLQYNQSKQQLTELQKTKAQLDAELQLSREESKTVRSLNEKHEQRLQYLEEEARKEKEEAAERSRREKEAVLSAHESSLALVTLQHKCSSLESGNGLLEKRVEQLQGEVEKNHDEANQLRREKYRELATLQSAKEEAQEKFSQASQQLERMKEELATERETLQELVQEKRKVEEDITKIESQWEAELRAQKRLTETYKIGEEKYKTKIAKLLAAVTELQKQNEIALNQKQEIELELLKLRTALAQKKQEVESLKSQLTETRELVVTPGEERDPLLALQDRNNIDSRVAALQKDNMLLNHTVRRLTKEIETITENITHHDAVFRRMSTDKEKLEKQMKVLNGERDRLLEERDTAVRELTKHRVIAERVEKHNRDLSRQVQCLLAQVENRFGTDARDIEEYTVTDVITNRLVTFTSIRELQEKNAELLSAVRELESIVEERENEDKRSLELEGLVNQLQREVKQLLDERDCQVEMNAAIRGQNVAQKEREESDTRDRKDINSLLQELDKLRTEKDQKISSLETKLDNIQNSLCQKKTEVAGLNAELGGVRLHNRTLESQFKTLQVEADSLKKRNASLLATVESQERISRDLQDYINSRDSKIEKLEARLQQLQGELQSSKSQLQAMNSKYADLQNKSMKQTHLIVELQDVKSQLGKMEESFQKRRQDEVEAKEKLLDEARKENEKLKDKLMKAEADLVDAKKNISGSNTPQKSAPAVAAASGNLCCVSYKDQLTKYQVITKGLEQQVNTEKENNARTQKMLKELKTCLTETKDANTANQNRLNAALTQALDETTRLQAQKELAEEKVTKLTEDLSATRTLLKSAELQLAEVRTQLESSTNQDTIRKLEAELTDSRSCFEKELMAHAKQVEETANLRARLETAERQRDEARFLASAGQNRSEQEENALRQHVERLQEEIEALQTRIEEHRSNYDQLLERLSPSAKATSLVLADAIEKEELTSVIDFLRQEQKLRSAELDSLTAENEKLKLKLERVEADLRKAQQEQSSQSTESVFLTQEKHAELIRKVELCQVYQESNQMLRQELEAARSRDKPAGVDETLLKENEILKKEVKSWQQRLQKAIQQPVQSNQMKESEEKLKKSEAELAKLAEEKGKVDDDAKKKDETIEQLRRLGRRYKAIANEREKEVTSKDDELEKSRSTLVELQQQLEAEKTKLEGLNREHQLRENTIKSQFEAKWKKQEEELRSLRSQIQDLPSEVLTEAGSSSASVTTTSCVASSPLLPTPLLPTPQLQPQLPVSEQTSQQLVASQQQVIPLLPTPQHIQQPQQQQLQQPSSQQVSPLLPTPTQILLQPQQQQQQQQQQKQAEQQQQQQQQQHQQQQQQLQQQQQQPSVATALPQQQIRAAAVMVRAVPQPPTASIRPMSARPRQEPPRVEVHPIQEDTPNTSGAQASTGAQSPGLAPNANQAASGTQVTGSGPSSSAAQAPSGIQGAAQSSSGAPGASSSQGSAGNQSVKRPQAVADAGIEEDNTSESKRARTEALLSESQERAAVLLADDDIGVEQGQPDDVIEPDAPEEDLVLELANDEFIGDALQQQGLGEQQGSLLPLNTLGGADDGIVPCTPTLVSGEDGATSTFVFQTTSSTFASASGEPSTNQDLSQDNQQESNQEVRNVPTNPQQNISVIGVGSGQEQEPPLAHGSAPPAENQPRLRRIIWQHPGGAHMQGGHPPPRGRGNAGGRGSRRPPPRANSIWRRNLPQ